MNIDFSNGNVRAVVVFMVAAAFIWMLFYMLNKVGISFFAQPILIVVGAGWAAYWVWKKTETGRY